jgi:hypothetical protein
MTFLKSLWRKLFPVKAKKGITLDDWNNYVRKVEAVTIKRLNQKVLAQTYDPSTDEHKIMSGEVESYFE